MTSLRAGSYERETANKGLVLPPTEPLSGPRLYGRTAVFVGGGIGDALIHTAQFEAIARGAAHGQITIACKKAPAIRELYLAAPYVEGVIAMSDDESTDGRASLPKAARNLAGFDTLWSFRRSTTIIVAAVLAKVKRRIGYYTRPSLGSALLTDKVRVPLGMPHPAFFLRSQLLINHFGLNADTAKARLAPTSEADLVAASLIGERPTIAIGLNSGPPTRQWGLPYVELVRRLAERYDIAFLLYGGPDVAWLAKAVVEGSGVARDRLIDLPKLGWPLSLSHGLLNRCRAYIGNDSSGLNLAAFCGLPSVGLFPATPPFTYSPCFIPIEPEPRSAGIEAITFAQVWTVATRTLDAVLADPTPRTVNSGP